MRTIQISFVIGFAFAAGACVANAQQPTETDTKPAYAADPANVPQAIAAVRSGKFFAVHLEMIARARAVQAIPDLEKQFVATSAPDLRVHIASVLVRLGLKDDKYWNYLIEAAAQSLKSAAPLPSISDHDGKAPGQPPAELAAWAREKGISIDDAFQKALFEDAGPMLMLVMTGDRRAIPLAREGLKSRNFMIQVMSARGLAGIQDRDSIPYIVAAVRSAPRDAAAGIATWLIYFDDTEAQRIVDAYVPKEQADAHRAEHAKGKGPFE